MKWHPLAHAGNMYATLEEMRQVWSRAGAVLAAIENYGHELAPDVIYAVRDFIWEHSTALCPAATLMAQAISPALAEGKSAADKVLIEVSWTLGIYPYGDQAPATRERTESVVREHGRPSRYDRRAYQEWWIPNAERLFGAELDRVLAA